MALLAHPITGICGDCGGAIVRWRARGSMVRCNRCSSNARVAKWKAANPERAKATNTQSSPEAKRRYAQSERGREIGRAKAHRWVRADPERARAARKANYEKNRDREIQKVVDRKKRLLIATPAWADRSRIAAIYREARRLTRETGVPQQVDHIIPLKGRIVCGLHVESNLRVITATENNMKFNRLDPSITEGNA